jgi:hypothetical protein
MSNIDEDIYCSKQPFDSTLFPVGSANFMDRNYNILPFLCNLLQHANDESVSPVIVEAPEFDITPFTDFSGLTAVGDPRVSLGETMEATYINFLPRMITQTEVMQAGGTQVIDNIICNYDGVPIKESKTIPILLSLDLTGQKSYQYGAITVPPISATFEDLMKPINPEEVNSFVNDYILKAKKYHADDFIKFINSYFLVNNWTLSLVAFQTPPLFLLKLEHYTNDIVDNTIYIKYYEDIKDYIGCNLGIDTIQTYINNSGLTTNAMVIAIGNTIPNYKYLMENLDKADEWYQYLLNSTITTVQNHYTDVFSTPEKAAAYMQSYNTVTAPVLSSVDVQCNY